MVNMGITNLNSADQNLMNSFFSSPAISSQPRGPRLNQQQLLNQMIHNAQNMRVRQEVSRLQAMFASDDHFKLRIQNADPDLYAALSGGDNSAISKIVSDRLKEIMKKQREE